MVRARLACLVALAACTDAAEPELSLAGVTSACGDPVDVPEEPRPAGSPMFEFDGDVPRSILFIVTDTFRRDALSLYGGERMSMPCLAARAEHVVRFDEYYATAPWTGPTTGSLVTGLYPENHEVLRVDTSGTVGVLNEPLDKPSFAGSLQAEGWATAIVSGNGWVSPRNGFDTGFGYANSWAGERGRTESDDLAEFTRGWLSDVPEDQRFFVHLQILDNHFHYLPRSEYEEAWINLEEYPWSVEVDAQDVLLAAWPGLASDDQASALEWLRGLYDAESLAQDAQIELTLQQLEQEGRLDDTLVVLAADHGESIGEEGLFGHGNSLRQELVHIPLVVYNPRLKGGTVSEIVRSIDVIPTLLAGIGVEVPSGIDGVAVIPGVGAEYAFGSYFPNSDDPLPSVALTYAALGDTKVVRDCLTGEDQAFNLESDPGELDPRSPTEVEGAEALVEQLDTLVTALDSGREYTACLGD